jgi:hypothetical protein
MSDNTKPDNDKDKLPKPVESATELEKLEKIELTSSNEVLKQFDAFEVEDMPESNELQERRRKIKNQLKELDMEPNREDANAAFGGEDEGGFLDILKEAGLGGRQIRFCCGGVVILGLLGFLIYGGVKWFGSSDFSFDFWGDETSSDEEPTGDNDGDDPSVTPTYPDATLWTGMTLGEAEQSNTGTTDAGEDIGLEGNSDEPLEGHINDFSKIYESAQVDVNQSSDRREALSDYVDELNFYTRLALKNQTDLQEESELLNRKFTVVETNKNEQESLFFDKIDALDAYASTAALNTFVGYSQEMIRLRAHYLAREKLLSYYEQVIPYMETKVRDIDLNEEALVKGIKVVEVQGSDLNLIQSESDL